MHAIRVALAWCALILVIAETSALHAQSYPAKNLKLVVPFGPGGPTDVAARVASQVLQSALGQSVDRNEVRCR